MKSLVAKTLSAQLILTTIRQRGRFSPSQPNWMRALATLCLLLVAALGTVQAAHVHGEWLPRADAHVSAPVAASQGQGEERCLLCVAMHTALRATLQVLPEPVQEIAPRLSALLVDRPQRRWSFTMFSRPPPAAELSLIFPMAV